MSHFRQNPSFRLLMQEWANGLVESIEMMLGQRLQVHWKEAGPPAQTEPMLWWRQSLSLGPDYIICAGSTSVEARSMGRFIFAAAGTEEIDDSEAKNTYLEVLSQSIAVLTRALASELNRQISGQDSQESEQPSGEFLASFELTANGQRLGTIHAAFSEKLLELLTAPAAPMRSEPHADLGMDETALTSRSLPYVLRSKTMDLLLEVELPVSISFGRAKIPLRDAIKLTTGSIVELNRTLTDPVEVIVNNCVIARGEVVVVDGNYGVRIQQIISREERLRTLR